MKNSKLTNILLYVFPAIAAVLNALPWCVQLRFMGDGEVFTEYVSGFSMLPVGYGVWCHMVTGICALVLMILGLIHDRKENPRLIRWMLSVSIVGVMMSLTPLAFGTATAVSTLAALAIGAEAVILYRLREDM